jgi:predicted hydrocarbon binding protein
MDQSNCYQFTWNQLGDIAQGRPNLGPTMHLAVYRLMQYTMREIICQRHGPEEATAMFRLAGARAGEEFCRNMLDRQLEFNHFIAQLQEKLRELGVGILRIEKADMAQLEFTLTVGEDLDCSGLPVTGEAVCEYDEGFLAGILGAYTGKSFVAREIDCWATGDRTCRFNVAPADLAPTC